MFMWLQSRLYWCLQGRDPVGIEGKVVLSGQMALV